jgi:Protein of unknown function (DUF1579)
MKRISTAVFLVFLLAAVLTQAQMPTPTPAPELKKLDYFVGTWSTDGDLKPGPMGSGGKVSGTAHDEWMEGNFFLVSHGSFNGVMGKGTEVAFIGYDPDQKTYTYTAFNSMGEHQNSTGTLEGDTWTWLGDENMGGQKMKGRFTMKILSPTSYTYKFELSPDGSNWSTVMDGKGTKTK